MTAAPAGLRRAAQLVALANLAYFVIEIIVATRIGSVALFADSMDFLEDATVNLLVLMALGWSVRRRAWWGAILAAVLLAPGVAALWTVWDKLTVPAAPAPVPLSLTGLGALLVNFGCALTLARWRRTGGSTARAAFLSARNDVAASVAIIASGAAVAWTHSFWPDVVVGLGTLAMNLDAAREVGLAARRERHAADEGGPP
ncbi:MAG: cation transporter [Acetobacteraceae bacterium]|nr:cation transporter [Acetobacteraceae bacterium]